MKENMTKKFHHALFVRWMRKAHGWIGLWGAVLGLLFGFSGIWLNHRAVLKLPPPLQSRQQVQLALPEPAPTTPEQMSRWLQTALALKGEANSIRVEKARAIAWPDQPAELALVQPERWVFNYGGPAALIQIEYWQGNRSVNMSTTSNGLIGTLTNLHKGVGMSVAWVLLVDTLAGSLIFLSLSGCYLWVLTNRRKTSGLLIAGLSVAVLAGLVSVRL